MEIAEIKNTLDELKEKRDKLVKELADINLQLDLYSVANIDYKGKYICVENERYMYVNESSVYKDVNDKYVVSLRGFAFAGDCNEYPDETYLSFDAFDEWKYSLESFFYIVERDKIQVISRNEFTLKFRALLTTINKNVDSILDKVISYT